MARANSYLDNSDAKKLARHQVYKRTKQLFEATRRPKGMAVILAGPEAAELGSLVHVLNFRPKDILAVDLEIEGLVVAKERYKSVETYDGDVNEALGLMLGLGDRAAFINLDFCGYLNEERLRSAKLAAQLLEPGGLLYYTFFRGREKDSHWKDLAGYVPEKSGQRETSRNRLDTVRFVNVAKKVQLEIGPEFELVFMLRYLSEERTSTKIRHSPMGILGWQRMPLYMRDAMWRNAVKNSVLEGATSGEIVSKEVQDGLKISALSLANQGKTSREIASVLNVPVGTVAAWLAHHTRGTYSDWRNKK